MSDDLTRSGVAYNLEKSPHKITINYGDNDTIIYTFSSQLYINKFISKLENLITLRVYSFKTSLLSLS